VAGKYKVDFRGQGQVNTNPASIWPVTTGEEADVSLFVHYLLVTFDPTVLLAHMNALMHHWLLQDVMDWHQRYHELREFKALSGHLHVDSAKDPTWQLLAEWVQLQHILSKEGLLGNGLRKKLLWKLGVVIDLGGRKGYEAEDLGYLGSHPQTGMPVFKEERNKWVRKKEQYRRERMLKPIL
jgi:hypothetical protein